MIHSSVGTDYAFHSMAKGNGMTEPSSTHGDSTSLAFLAGGGEMGERIRSFDWSSSPIGPPGQWPQSLQASLSICLSTQFPIAIYWGPNGLLLYNDAWRPILGDKHPWALGRPGREVWSEIWDVVGPIFEGVMGKGEGRFFNDALLMMHRFGYTEECYFDYTFSPIRGLDGGVDGVFNAVTETTDRVLNARRGKLLREIAAGTSAAKSAVEACELTAAAVATDMADLPFSQFYLIDQGHARLCAATGFPASDAAGPTEIDIASDMPDQWPIAAVVQSGEPQVVDLRCDRFGELPGGAWAESPRQAVVLPIAATGQGSMAGAVVLGASPCRVLDEAYRDFMDLLAGHLATAVANARAYEEERNRAEALAELDRAKTQFFSNVSHEFRTPLTLILGPVEDLLMHSHTDLPPAAKTQLEVVYRNGLRLLRLVNCLLDFSRIEAGGVRAKFEPTDLAAFTCELASVFRSAIEQAGLRLVVNCPPLPEPVFVDREMWEKVVLNLLSNAFKFTFEGEIEVALGTAGDSTATATGERSVQLRVRDTGTGISSTEMPRLFDRFHRIENARRRTHEGSGIGLALVHELVKLHGGSITAESELGQGTTFIVAIPMGAEHLPAGRIGSSRALASSATGANPFVEEALRWLPVQGEKANTEFDELASQYDSRRVSGLQPALAQNDDRPRILVADDNADMREYIRQLLSEQFDVEAVADGKAALEAARANRPELVISDVMMPGLDGFALLRELRADPELNVIPVVLLSARAGETASIEGMEAGADDYLIKPFNARELLARVESHLKMSRLRRESEQILRQSDARKAAMFQAALDCIISIDHEGRIIEFNPAAERTFGYRRDDVLGREMAELIVPPSFRERHRQGIAHFLATGEGPVLDRRIQMPALRSDGTEFPVELAVTCVALDGPPQFTAFLRDITDRTRWEEALRKSEELSRQRLAELQTIYASAPIGLAFVNRELRYVSINQTLAELDGMPVDQVIGKTLREVLTSEVADEVEPLYRRVIETGEPIRGIEVRGSTRTGGPRDFLVSYHSVQSATGEVLGVNAAVLDITDRKRLEDELRQVAANLSEANRRKDEFLATLAHELRNPLAPIRTGLELLKMTQDDRITTEEIRSTMERQMQQLIMLIDDLMDVSRITRGKLQLRRCRVRVADVIESAIEASRPFIDEANHELTIAVADDPIYIHADPHRLAQVLTNLLNNAAKYTPVGGNISCSACKADGDVLISVKDNGIGIPSDMLERVFDMFAQINPPAERTSSGLGIGLTLVKSLVEMHGGSIQVQSQGVSQGSTFTIRLPTVEFSPEEEAKLVQADNGKTAKCKRRVLVVDDNQAAAEMLSMVVKMLGNEVRTASDGQQAIEVAAEFLPDVVLMDIGMPKMNGHEAARQIRRQPWGKEMLLVAVTGWGQEEDQRKTNESGFDHHLVKPAEPAAVQKLIAESLANQKSARRQDSMH